MIEKIIKKENLQNQILEARRNFYKKCDRVEKYKAIKRSIEECLDKVEEFFNGAEYVIQFKKLVIMIVSIMANIDDAVGEAEAARKEWKKIARMNQKAIKALDRELKSSIKSMSKKDVVAYALTCQKRYMCKSHAIVKDKKVEKIEQKIYEAQLPNIVDVKEKFRLFNMIAHDIVIAPVAPSQRYYLMSKLVSSYGKDELKADKKTFAFNAATCRDVKDKISAKETIMIRNINVFGKGVRLNDQEKLMLDGIKAFEVDGNEKTYNAATVTTFEPIALGKVLAKAVFGEIGKCKFLVNTKHGVLPVNFAKGAMNIVQVCTSSGPSNKNEKSRLATMMKTNVLVCVEGFVDPNGKEVNMGSYLWMFLVKGSDGSRSFCPLESSEISGTIPENLLWEQAKMGARISFFSMLAASTSSKRQEKALWMQMDVNFDNYEQFVEKAQDRHYAKREMILDWATSGGYKHQREKLSNATERAKFIKLLERDILELSDIVFADDGSVDIGPSAMYNGDMETIFVDEDGNVKSVPWQDGHGYISTKIQERFYSWKFRIVNSLKKSVSRLMSFIGLAGYPLQGRRHYVKGEHEFVTPKHMKTLLQAVTSGKFKNIRKEEFVIAQPQPVVYYLLKGKNYLGETKGKNIVWFEKSEDVLNYKFPENTLCVFDTLNFEEVEFFGDTTVYKDIFNFLKPSPFSLMAYPPKMSNKVSMSNQIFFTLMGIAGIDAVYDNKSGKNIPKEDDFKSGLEIMIQLFEENVEKRLSKMLKASQNLDMSLFETIDYPDDLIRSILPQMFWSDPNMKKNAFKQLATSFNKIIDKFGVEVEGFHAIGLIDPGVILRGYPFINSDEMCSGNAKTRRLVAVFRHPKAGEAEFSLLWDIPVSELIRRVDASRAFGEINENQWEAAYETIENISDRMALFPTFDPRFADSHGGSDSDGDAFSCITEWSIVEACKKVEAKAISYGDKYKDPNTKWVLVNGHYDPNSNHRDMEGVYIELLEGGNKGVGQCVTFMGKGLSLYNEMFFNRMSDNDFNILLEKIKSLESEYNYFGVDGKLPSVLALMCTSIGDQRKSYQRKFAAKYVEIDNQEVKNWIIYCLTYKIETQADLMAWLLDFICVMSSVIGRTVDAAKSGEPVLVPFYELNSIISSALGKDKPGKTSVVISYNEDKCLFEGEILKSGWNEDQSYYIPKCQGWMFKNICCVKLVERLNKFIAETNEISASTPVPNTSVTYQSSIQYEGLMNNMLQSYRPESYKEVKEYFVNSVRMMTRNLHDIDRFFRVFNSCKKDDGTITRFYTAFGVEMTEYAALLRQTVEGHSSKVSTKVFSIDRDYVFENGQVINLIEGKNDDMFINCKVSGDFEITVKNGIPYIDIDVVELIKKFDDVNNKKFALQIMPVLGRSFKDTANMLIEAANNGDFFVTVADYKKYGGAYLVKINGEEIKVVAYIFTPQMYVNNQKVYEDLVSPLINGKMITIDNALYYQDSGTEERQPGDHIALAIQIGQEIPGVSFHTNSGLRIDVGLANGEDLLRIG